MDAAAAAHEAVTGDPVADLTLYHAAPSRSSGVLILLDELGADYRIQLLDIQAGDQHKADYLAINPLGKVPAVRHGDAVVTEQVAIYVYLADLHPKARLAPAIGDPLRGPYLRWVAFYGSCFEPALVDRSMKREPAARAISPYADFDTMLGALLAQLEAGPWLLGERFSAADVLWGSALGWTTRFQLLPMAPAIERYLARFDARPAVQRARARDAEMAARQPPREARRVRPTSLRCSAPSCR